MKKKSKAGIWAINNNFDFLLYFNPIFFLICLNLFTNVTDKDVLIIEKTVFVSLLELKR